MRIDWLEYENKDHVVSWFLLEAMSSIGIDKFGKFDSSNLDVNLTVNGLDVPFMGVLNNLNNQLDDMAAKAKKAGKQEMITDISIDFAEFLALKYNLDD